MDPIRERRLLLTRRHFFGRMATGIGVAALGSLLDPAPLDALADTGVKANRLPLLPHLAPTARRVIYLFMAGGPSQKGQLHFKPSPEKHHATEVAQNNSHGQRHPPPSTGPTT